MLIDILENIWERQSAQQHQKYVRDTQKLEAHAYTKNVLSTCQVSAKRYKTEWLVCNVAKPNVTHNKCVYSNNTAKLSKPTYLGDMRVHVEQACVCVCESYEVRASTSYAKASSFPRNSSNAHTSGCINGKAFSNVSSSLNSAILSSIDLHFFAAGWASIQMHSTRYICAHVCLSSIADALQLTLSPTARRIV